MDVNLNLDFSEKLHEHSRGVENKRYLGYTEQFTERKRSNGGDNQKNLPKSVNHIEQNTLKRQISIIDKLDVNPEFPNSEKLNFPLKKN